MKKKRIYLSSPTMHGEELEYIREAFDTNWVAPLGPNVDEFEKEIAEYLERTGIAIQANSCQRTDRYLGTDVMKKMPDCYAAALSSGTAALHLALINEGIGTGDVVLCSDLTFSATCNPIVYQGAQPVFVDSEKESWNMDPIALCHALELYPHTKCVVAVNLYGTPAKLDEIAAICQKYGVPLIEDAAESLGASYKGQMTGTFGDQAALSFNGNKIITTSGGGMLLSGKEGKIIHARFLATQAREPARHYEHKEIGYNYRMSNVVAGIGRGQLRHLEEHIAKKKEIYEIYREAFADLDMVEMNPIPKACDANYWLSCLALKEGTSVRTIDLMKALEDENIESRPIWKPMHLQPVFRYCPFVTAEDCRVGLDKNLAVMESTEDQGEIPSVSEEIFERGMCLPSDVKNTSEDMDRIIEIIRKYLY